MSDLLPASFLNAPTGWPTGLEWPPPLPSLGPGPEKLSLKEIRNHLHAGNQGEAGAASGRSISSAAEAGILLWFGHLDASHELSQDLNDLQGSYWHGLMHRREPDHANAAYWFRRVGSHSIFAQLAGVLAQVPWKSAALASRAARKAAWDPYWMNDCCEEARNGGSASFVLELQGLQWAEYHLLLRDCFDGSRHSSRSL